MLGGAISPTTQDVRRHLRRGLGAEHPDQAQDHLGLADAALALDEAHQIGLIHRDVKPSNIMLTHQGGAYDFVKVVDFGLVKDRRLNHVLREAYGGRTFADATIPLYVAA